MAVDFRTVCEAEFPVKVTADYVARHHSDPNEMSTRRNMILATKWVQFFLQNFLYINFSTGKISTVKNNIRENSIREKVHILVKIILL